jgi:conjugative transfer region lipoprotein (TIGR03751 family)
MRIPIMLLCLFTLISLMGCSSLRGNVVPQTGPSMEQVYDSMGVNKPNANASMANSTQQAAYLKENQGEADVTEIRQNLNTVHRTVGRKTRASMEKSAFRKLPNPELTMYVYPHLAGNAEIPIPGYETAFPAYARDHYALPKETP